DEGEDGEDPAEGELRVVRGRGRVVVDRGENRRREVGHGGRGRQAAGAMEARRGRCELAARRALVEVRFDRARLDAGILTVETGRDRVTDVSAAHTGSVAYEGSGVPPVS